MSNVIRSKLHKSLIAFCLFVTHASTSLSQTIQNDLIGEAVAGFISVQRAQGTSGVKIGLEECWSNAYKKKSLDAAVYCSAFNFAASNFDETSVAVMGYPSSLSTGEATSKSRKAFILSGVSKDKVAMFVLTVRQKAILSYTQAMRSR